jgi:3-methyl-2-oxobutanoate hydroxymethyltransferase
MPRLTIPELVAKKSRGEKLVALTAYDAPFARLADEAGADILLVGDSLAMTVLGHDSTVPVTMDEMLHHTRAVVRGSARAHVVFDMPFMSYQASANEAMRNAGRALKESGAQSVKFEGGERYAPLVRRMVESGIAVMGHVGLGPQSSLALGGYPAMGTDPQSADQVIDDAEALVEAGAYALVLERVPSELATIISQRVRVPTIGIAAGAGCDGQVQVMHDLLGLDERFRPRHAGQYGALAATIREAFAAYAADVRAGTFPTEQHGVKTSDILRAHLRSR